jgi:hypothetical protein
MTADVLQQEVDSISWGWGAVRVEVLRIYNPKPVVHCSEAARAVASCVANLPQLPASVVLLGVDRFVLEGCEGTCLRCSPA